MKRLGNVLLLVFSWQLAACWATETFNVLGSELKEKVNKPLVEKYNLLPGCGTTNGQGVTLRTDYISPKPDFPAPTEVRGKMSVVMLKVVLEEGSEIFCMCTSIEAPDVSAMSDGENRRYEEMKWWKNSTRPLGIFCRHDRWSAFDHYFFEADCPTGHPVVSSFDQGQLIIGCRP